MEYCRAVGSDSLDGRVLRDLLHPHTHWRHWRSRAEGGLCEMDGMDLRRTCDGRYHHLSLPLLPSSLSLHPRRSFGTTIDVDARYYDGKTTNALPRSIRPLHHSRPSFPSSIIFDLLLSQLPTARTRTPRFSDESTPLVQGKVRRNGIGRSGSCAGRRDREGRRERCSHIYRSTMDPIRLGERTSGGNVGSREGVGSGKLITLPSRM